MFSIIIIWNLEKNKIFKSNKYIIYKLNSCEINYFLRHLKLDKCGSLYL